MGDLDAAASCEPRIGSAPGSGNEATVFEVQTQEKCMRLSVPAPHNGQAGDLVGAARNREPTGRRSECEQ